MVLYNLSKLQNISMNSVYDGSDMTPVDKLNLKYINYTIKETNQKYNILKYDKTFLTDDRVETAGLFRSIIVKDGKILCFSPPKSMNKEMFKKKHTQYNGCVGEEFIEGTMVNVFFDPSIDDWEISTKSTVGGRNTFFRDGEISYENTFRYMFLDVAGCINLDFDCLNKSYCYSFVMQHPENRIVTPFCDKNIYLVGCYSINDDFNVETVPFDSIKDNFSGSQVKFPKVYSIEEVNDIKSSLSSNSLNYKVMGIVIKHSETGDRMKIRNPTYEYVRELKGNQPKLQYQYIVLRKEGKVREYLKYYPEASERFSMFRKQIHGFTLGLYSNYCECYIKKTKPLIQYPENYRTHMYLIHQEYLTNLREKKQFVNKSVVIDYVNSLHSSKLMYSVNFPMRKRQVDIAKVDQ